MVEIYLQTHLQPDQYFHIIGNMESQTAVTALSALAQSSRLSIFRLLVEAGPGGMAAGHIGESLGLAPATLSFHLKELSHAGLVDARQEGRFVIYSAQFSTMNALIQYLTENCCGGQPCCDPAPVPANASTPDARTRRTS